MSDNKLGLRLKGDLKRRAIGFRFDEDVHTAVQMVSRDYNMRKSDLVRRLVCDFLYYHKDSIDEIEDEVGSELRRAINVGKRDYDRIFNINESLDDDKVKKVKKNIKKDDIKKDVSSFDLTDIDNLL